MVEAGGGGVCMCVEEGRSSGALKSRRRGEGVGGAVQNMVEVCVGQRQSGRREEYGGGVGGAAHGGGRQERYAP
jgi:hypothetical protein